MSTATLHSDPVAAFNSQLAHAKIHALRLLQDLMASLTDPDAGVGAALREMRLAATAILRAQPMKQARPAPNSPPAPPQTQDSEPQDSGHSSPPTYRADLDPVRRAARDDIRALIRAGVPEVVRLWPHGFPPRSPPAPP